MQYPGTSPFGGFGGANVLASRLTPSSLEQRKQQLIHQMVTGSGNSNLTVGATRGDAPGRAPGLGFNPFMESYLSSINAAQDPASPFYGGGGSPNVPTPNVPTPGPPPVNGGPVVSSDPAVTSPMATGSGVQVANPTAPAGGNRQLINTYVPARGGIVGGHNMYYGLDPQGVGAIANSLAMYANGGRMF